LSFHLYRHAGHQQVDLVGVLGDKLVGSAQQVAVDAAEPGLGHNAHDNLVGDDDEAGLELVRGGDKLVYFGRHSFFRFRVVRLIMEQVGHEPSSVLVGS